MMRPILRYTCDVLATILTGVMVLTGFAVWRLSVGPVQVDGLEPHLERALSTDRMAVRVDRTMLEWQGWRRALTVMATDVDLATSEGGAIAHLRQLNVRLDGRRLAAGRLAVKSATLVAPVLHVLRDEEGSFSVAVGDETTGAERSSPDDEPLGMGLADFLGGLRDASSDDDPLAGISRLSVTDGVVIVDDRWLGLRWQAEDADIDLRRGVTDVSGRISLAVPFDDGGEVRAARQSASFRYEFDSGRAEAHLDVANIVPSALARRHPVLTPLSAIESVFEGTIDVHLGDELETERVRFSARGGAGRIDLQDLYGREMTVAAVTIDGEADFTQSTLTLETLAIDLGGPHLSASADLRERDGIVDVTAEFDLANLPVDLIDQYWPPPAVPGGRDWVTENISMGFVRTLHGRVSGRFPADDPGAVDIRGVEGELTLDGAAVRYLPALPIVQSVSGTGRFDMDSLILEVGGGHSLDLRIPDATIIIDYSGMPETIDIAADITGPLGTVLEVLDRPGLEYTRTVGLNPERVSGTTSGRLRLAFPLIGSLTMDEVALAAAANVAGASLGEMVEGIEVYVDQGAMELDGLGLAVTGTGTLNGVAVDFDWRERFDAAAAERTLLTIIGDVDEEGRQALGLPDTSVLRGPVGAEIVLVQSANDQSLTGDLDLTSADMGIDAIDWSKPAGTAGSARFVARWGEDGAISLQDIAIDAADLSVRGSVQLLPDPSEIETAQIDQLAWRDNRLYGSVGRTPAGGYSIGIGGSYFDASGLVDTVFDGGDSDGAEDPAPPLELRLDLDRVLLAEDRELHDVAGTLVNDGSDWVQADLAALSASGGPLNLQLQPTADAGFTLRIAAGDAGDALAAFGILDSVNGGRLSLDAARQGVAGPVHGTLTASEFRLRQAPVMARLLAALSLSGLSDLLNTDGIGFDGVTAELTLDGDRLTIADGRMAGGSLGLTVEGVVDLAADTLDTEGTIVPVYGVSRVIGEIPVLGDLLTGGEGEGILAFNYAISGPLDDPQVSVNPLSVLAPGVLRDLFPVRGAAWRSERLARRPRSRAVTGTRAGRGRSPAGQVQPEAGAGAAPA